MVKDPGPCSAEVLTAGMGGPPPQKKKPYIFKLLGDVGAAVLETTV